MPGFQKEEIMRLFRAQKESVLFGLDTFWYGVDFPGPTCEYVVMPKLPYGAPDDYMIAQQARMGWGPQRNAIYLPKALAMFRQGCGRLLRSESDRGAVVLLDRRVLEKRHANFLKELPTGPEEWQVPEVIQADTEECFERIFAHMRLGGEIERRGLTASFLEARGALRP
jgi:Rad3-related DNA helicase